MSDKMCISTKIKVANDHGSVSFKCPQCQKYEIVRSSSARINATVYECPNCGFKGPN